MDNTKLLTPFVDPHLLMKVLDFFLNANLYDEKKILHTRLFILQNTNMNELARDTYKKLFPQKELTKGNARLVMRSIREPFEESECGKRRAREYFGEVV